MGTFFILDPLLLWWVLYTTGTVVEALAMFAMLTIGTDEVFSGSYVTNCSVFYNLMGAILRSEDSPVYVIGTDAKFSTGFTIFSWFAVSVSVPVAYPFFLKQHHLKK